jgi:hypothetical protein
MKQAQRGKKAGQRRFEGRFSTIVIAIITVAMLVTLAALVWNKSTIPAKTTDYEGVIVDR